MGVTGYLLIGDSHSRDFYHVIKKINPEINVSTLVQSGCVPLEYGNCFSDVEDLSLNDIILHYIDDKRVKGIIFSSLYNADFDVINDFLENTLEYAKYGNIFIVNAGPYNRGLIDDFEYNNGYFDLSNSDNLNKIKINAMIEKTLTGSNIVIIDKYKTFCDGLKCKLLDGLTPLFADSHHLTVQGYEYFSEHFKPEATLY